METLKSIKKILKIRFYTRCFQSKKTIFGDLDYLGKDAIKKRKRAKTKEKRNQKNKRKIYKFR